IKQSREKIEQGRERMNQSRATIEQSRATVEASCRQFQKHSLFLLVLSALMILAGVILILMRYNHSVFLICGGIFCWVIREWAKKKIDAAVKQMATAEERFEDAKKQFAAADEKMQAVEELIQKQVK
ncbi:TPA: hypothetical protein DDW35_05975, partial [Candidatus Sumerlaeota bacterium]|nr:hypothetical protein [Candidatus Sumerlaeota bacterium]